MPEIMVDRYYRDYRETNLDRDPRARLEKTLADVAKRLTTDYLAGHHSQAPAEDIIVAEVTHAAMQAYGRLSDEYDRLAADIERHLGTGTKESREREPAAILVEAGHRLRNQDQVIAYERSKVRRATALEFSRPADELAQQVASLTAELEQAKQDRDQMSAALDEILKLAAHRNTLDGQPTL